MQVHAELICCILRYYESPYALVSNKDTRFQYTKLIVLLKTEEQIWKWSNKWPTCGIVWFPV